MKTNELQEGQQIVVTLDKDNGPCPFTVLTVEESGGHYRASVQNDLYGIVWIDDNVGDIQLV
ncbi:hypothetical protein SAMN04487787_10882 [Kosakonia sacchari]|nr:hypothetical protein SAMN04487787_10882 [Kosakonia sacchari]